MKPGDESVGLDSADIGNGRARSVDTVSVTSSGRTVCLQRSTSPEGRGARDILPSETNPFILIEGDAYEVIRTLPEASIDAIVTDPPYNLGTYSTGNIKMSWRKDFNNDIARWDRSFDPSALKDDFVRILKPGGNIFAFTGYNLLGRWHETFDPVFDTFQFMVWHKTNPPPKLRRAGFLNSCELIVCMWNKGHTWNFTTQKEMHNFIETPICMGRERVKDPVHPTQKPLKVLRHIVGLCTNPGDTVLDPFMGVGSTGVAAVEMGRFFIGVEMEGVYCRKACMRLERASRGDGPAR